MHSDCRKTTRNEPLRHKFNFASEIGFVFHHFIISSFCLLIFFYLVFLFPPSLLPQRGIKWKMPSHKIIQMNYERWKAEREINYAIWNFMKWKKYTFPISSSNFLVKSIMLIWCCKVNSHTLFFTYSIMIHWVDFVFLHTRSLPIQ